MDGLRSFELIGPLRADLRVRFQALYRVTKDRTRTLDLLDLFWPPGLEKPERHFNKWFNDVEYGKSRIPPPVQKWVNEQVEQKVLNDLQATGMEASLTLRQLLGQLRDGKIPTGGITAIRYLQETVRDHFGKRAEIMHADKNAAKKVPGGRSSVITRGKEGSGKPPPGLRAVK